MCGLQSESSKQRFSASSVNLLRRMASTKKTGFIVETKSVSEKKRRKSDLVVMWITLWDVILYVATEIWMTVQSVMEVGKYFFNSEEVWQIRSWLEEHLSQVPEDFSQSWRDGVLFCKLLNKLQPGCYPDANRLDINFGVRNLTKAFHILETRFDIIPRVTVEEIVTCSKDSESKLVDLLLQVKRKTDDIKNNNEVEPATEANENTQENGETETESCIAKGTGLMVGFVGRAASFGVFFSSLSDLNLVVEIRGPSNTIWSEKVTKRSPKKKHVIKPWKPFSPHAVVRSSSNEESKALTLDDSQDLPTETEKSFIPLEYEIHLNQISFTYYPLIEGEHRIAILFHGQHVSDSPYLVNVEPSVRVSKIENMAHIKSVLKPQRRCHESEEENPKKSSVRFQEPSERKERLGKILKRKVLRYIVKIGGKDVVLDTDSIETMATTLLKMDYELQKRPLIRRNSWGFVGDAERKISAIRQFGIDLDELEAQSIKMQRSHSLSFSPITKKPTKLNTSYECEDIIQQKTLETVTEGRVSNFSFSSESHKEEDESFAVMNEDFCRISDVKIEGSADERKDLYTNPSTNSRDKFSEKPCCDSNLREMDLSPSTTQAQILLKSIITDAKNLIESSGIPEDDLSSKSEGFFRLDKEFLTQKTEMETNDKSQIIELSSNHFDHMAAGTSYKEYTFEEVKKRIADFGNNVEDFKDLEDTDNVFIEEIPFTKTNATGVSNHAYNENMFQLLDTTKPHLHKYENSSQLNKIRHLQSNSEDCNSEPTEINNSEKKCQCQYFMKTSTGEENLNSFIKNNPPINAEVKSKNINKLKVRYKSFFYSNMKKNKTKGQRLNKYQHLGQKVKPNHGSYYTKRCRSSPKSLLENLLMKKLQCIIQNIDYENISSMSKRMPLKSTKNSTASEPTYNSFKKVAACQNLDYNRNENAHLETKYENREGISKYQSNSRSRGTIPVVTNTRRNNTISTSSNNSLSTDGNNSIITNSNNSINANSNNTISTIGKNTINTYDNNTIDTNSHLSNMCSKINVKEKERRIKVWPVASKAEIEPQHLRANFNIYHHTKTDCISKKHSMIYEPFSASAMNSGSNHSCESFAKNSYENSSENSPTKDVILKNTCQFSYTHFNPSFQFDRENPVKKQIKLWETSTIQRNDKPISKYMDKLRVLPELVDIKGKLKFWESAYHHSENDELKDRKISKNSDDVFKKGDKSDTRKSHSAGIIFEENTENQNQVPSDHGSKEETNINNSKSLDKPVDSKILNMDSKTAKQRSFSDPCVLDKPDDDMEDNISHLGYRNEAIMAASSKDEMSSSNDGNFIELFADDEDSSMDLLCSTEDEYIDDEISENISTYWGDLSLMKAIKAYDSSEYEEFLQLMTAESLQSCADECKFFGIATYFGHVAVKNRFWVLTKGAGRGNLSASVQGIGQHNVAFVSVEYTRKDIYEVTYQVFIPGLYLISVRWMDTPIPGSPYLCKVTF